MSRDEIARRCAESRAAQGLPRKIEDPTTLEVVATLLRADEGAPRQARSAS